MDSVRTVEVEVPFTTEPGMGRGSRPRWQREYEHRRQRRSAPILVAHDKGRTRARTPVSVSKLHTLTLSSPISTSPSDDFPSVSFVAVRMRGAYDVAVSEDAVVAELLASLCNVVVLAELPLVLFVMVVVVEAPPPLPLPLLPPGTLKPAWRWTGRERASAMVSVCVLEGVWRWWGSVGWNAVSVRWEGDGELSKSSQGR